MRYDLICHLIFNQYLLHVLLSLNQNQCLIVLSNCYIIISTIEPEFDLKYFFIDPLVYRATLTNLRYLQSLGTSPWKCRQQKVRKIRQKIIGTRLQCSNSNNNIIILNNINNNNSRNIIDVTAKKMQITTDTEAVSFA